MKPTSAQRQLRGSGARKTYHYYASRIDNGDARIATRLPAIRLEQFVLRTLASHLGDAEGMAASLRDLGAPADVIAPALAAASVCASDLPDRIRKLVERIDIRNGAVTITIRSPAIVDEELDLPALRIEERLEMAQAGRARPIVLGATAGEPRRDAGLIAMVADARRWTRALASGAAPSVQAITELEGLAKGAVSRILPLAHLAPDIAQAILDGRQPLRLTTKRLRTLPDLPLDWVEQRALLGFAPA